MKATANGVVVPMDTGRLDIQVEVNPSGEKLPLTNINATGGALEVDRSSLTVTGTATFYWFRKTQGKLTTCPPELVEIFKKAQPKKLKAMCPCPIQALVDQLFDDAIAAVSGWMWMPDLLGEAKKIVDEWFGCPEGQARANQAVQPGPVQTVVDALFDQVIASFAGNYYVTWLLVGAKAMADGYMQAHNL